MFPAVPPAKARKARDHARDLLAQGTDPSAHKQERKLAQRLAVGTSYEAVARSWCEHWSGPRSQRHADDVLRRLEADVFPVIGHKPIGEVTAPMLLAMAKRVLRTCGQVFRSRAPDRESGWLQQLATTTDARAA